MGVVHHSNYLRLIEDARMDWLDANIMNYKQMEGLGVIIPCAAASGKFLAFLRYDDPFSVEVKLVQYSGVKMVFNYEVRNSDTGVLCYSGESTHFFSTDSQRTGKEYAPWPSSTNSRSCTRSFWIWWRNHRISKLPAVTTAGSSLFLYTCNMHFHHFQ